MERTENIRWGITWTEGPVFPDLIKGGAMGVVDGCIVHAAGITFPWRERETGWWLDPSEGVWHPLPPCRREGHIRRA